MQGGTLLKWLTAIKLINWHYFVNETIRLRGSTLLTGDNGSGKSTILDAVQFALVADLRKVRFNVAAHDDTNRDLKGYLRCRTGRDDPKGGDGQGYLRDGDFTSYVALEFHDTTRRDYFVVGVAVDTFAGEPDTPQFFRAAGPLDDTWFLQGDRPLSASEFRAALRQRRDGEVFGSAAAYRTALRAMLGHLDDRFFTLVVKALGFQPITDIRKFVYDYVLDEREVKIDVMLENFRQYREYDALVRTTKEKLARLDEINAKYAQKTDVEFTAAVQEYVILRAGQEASQEELGLLRSKHADAERSRAELQRQQELLRKDISQLENDLQDLRDARARNDAYLALQALDSQLETLRRELADLEQRIERLVAGARHEIAALATIRRLAQEKAAQLGLGPDDTPLLAVVDDATARLHPLAQGEFPGPASTETSMSGTQTAGGPAFPDAGAASAAGVALNAALQQLNDRAVLQDHKLKEEQEALQAEKRELESVLEDLRRRKIRYPAAVEALRGAIRRHLDGLEAKVLCEMIDVPSERWQNAVEGYLNTQRFDLFVPPEAFDAALAVYERSKMELHIESVGLVNSEALLRSRPVANPGSLAEEVVTQDPAARAYIDRLLGRVMKCENEQELKKYAVAITPTCMTYRNHTARQIEFRVYEVPYIGARAVARQMELKQKRWDDVQTRLAEIADSRRVCGEFLSLVRGREAARLLEEAWPRVARLREVRAAIRQKEDERAQIDLGSLHALQAAIAAKEMELAAARGTLEDTTRAEARAMSELEHLASEIARAEEQWQERERALQAYVREHPETEEPGSTRYAEARRSRSNQVIVQNYTQSRQGLLTQADNLAKELVHLRWDYNTRYQFGGAPDDPRNDAYEAEYRKLAESELPAYEEKIAHARAAAEEEFKEHFIFRLQENIHLAKQEFDNLNRVLRDIPFGEDHYQFVYAPQREYRNFYDMIMDEYAMEGQTLFGGQFQEKHGATLGELFRLILDVPPEQQAENIRRFTDYRTYLDYDIKIHHAGGETSSFSKVAREKSGGESQTPYYVAIVASFLQLYRPGQNPHTVRLMMFDEAFNRMDPDRAEHTLEFIRRLGLQVLAAAPTDKCEIIAPYVETTLLVMRDGHRAWLEDYHQVLASPETLTGPAPVSATAPAVTAEVAAGEADG